MRVEGEVVFEGREVRRWRNVYALRKKIGVVFPLPVGLPLSIYNNVALAPRLSGTSKKADLDVIVERCLTRADSDYRTASQCGVSVRFVMLASRAAY